MKQKITTNLKEINLKNMDEIDKFNYFEYLDKILKDKTAKYSNIKINISKMDNASK
jgi:hypothetical protein